MTLKESLFNKGIFQAILRRFRLGSLLYFIILFLSVPTVYLTQNPYHLRERYFGIRHEELTNATSLIFQSGMIILPIITTFIVSTVVALLVYNYVHSSRHAIFAHSLPLTRKATYFSSLLASFTLMAIPVILNGIILIIMSLCGYGKLIGIIPSIVWCLILLCTAFIMFSISTFSAFLTGNSFALVAINVMLLLLPLAFAGATSLLCDMFLFGFTDTSIAFEKIILASPPIWIVDTGIGTNPYFFFTHSRIWIFVIAALLFYMLSYFLYKKRRIELCGEVAAFTLMHPILKYTVCAVGFIISFGIFSTMGMSPVFYYLLTALVTSIIYFACEMVLRKNLRIFKHYKGLLGFFLCTAIVISFMAFTSVFGYEKRIPKAQDVQSAALFTSYNMDIPYVEDSEFIQKVVAFHEDMLSDIPVINDNYLQTSYASHIRTTFKYILKNGKEISRSYSIDEKTKNMIMSSLFECEEYKKKFTGISGLNIENIKSVTVGSHFGSMDYSTIINEAVPMLFEALEKDISEISYEEYISRYPLSMYINIGLDYSENLDAKIFKIEDGDEKYMYYHFDIELHPSFKNTMKVLRDCGYIDELKNYYAKNLYVSLTPVYYKNNVFTFLNETYDLNMKITIPSDHLRKLSDSEGAVFFENMLGEKTDEKEKPFEENYYVFCKNAIDYKDGFAAATFVKRYSGAPEFLK